LIRFENEFIPGSPNDPTDKYDSFHGKLRAQLSFKRIKVFNYSSMGPFPNQTCPNSPEQRDSEEKGV
jgi:hypothetical protein